MDLKERAMHSIGQSIGLVISTKLLIEVGLFITFGAMALGINWVADKFGGKK